MCKKVSGGSCLWEDLYQEFRIKVWTKEDKIIEANEGGYLEVYCYSIIHNLLMNKGRVNSPLYNICDNLGDLADYKAEVLQESKTNVHNNRTRETIKKAVSELNKLVNSENKNVKFKAGLLKDVCLNKNMRRVSMEQNINYRTVYEAVKETSKVLKGKL